MQIDAKKERFGREEALRLARQATELVVVKGKSLVRIDMKHPPPEDELVKLLLGPSQNLRAPTVRKGSTLVVGFDPGAYARLLGGASG